MKFLARLAVQIDPNPMRGLVQQRMFRVQHVQHGAGVRGEANGEAECRSGCVGEIDGGEDRAWPNHPVLP